MRTEYAGDILTVRAVEDCIRATRRYTEGLFTRFSRHPVQGSEFPSRTLTKHYDVYPLMDVGWDMSIYDATFWAAGETPHVDVQFRYSYPTGKAHIIIQGGDGVVRLLDDNLPGFGRTLAGLVKCGRHRRVEDAEECVADSEPIEPVAGPRVV